MRSFIRNLSAPAEFCLVISICFGWPIVRNIAKIADHLRHTAQPFEFSDGLVFWGVIYQLLALAFVFWIGRIRGWSFGKFGLQVSWRWTGAGILLFVAVLLALSVQGALLIYLGVSKTNSLAGGLTLPFVILLSVVNPVFEEILQTGYFVRALQRFGMWPAVLASAFFRSFMHAHTGIIGVLPVLLVGLIFGLAYWRWRQLWPLIVAHAILDVFALLSLIRAA